MQTYRMQIKTETVNEAGRTVRHTETVPNLLESELEQRRNAARLSAPRGATRTIRVTATR